MKALNKVSVAYALQIVAVIVLFGYALTSSGKAEKETINNSIIQPAINKQLSTHANHDSLAIKKTNTWSRFAGKGW